MFDIDTSSLVTVPWTFAARLPCDWPSRSPSKATQNYCINQVDIKACKVELGPHHVASFGALEVVPATEVQIPKFDHNKSSIGF